MNQIAEKIYVETNYPGVNVGTIVTRKGLICIDTPSFPRDARNWSTRVHQIHPYAVEYLVLTDFHGDRILNARWLNAPVLAHEAVADRLRSYDKRYPQSLLESLASRNPELGRELSQSPVEHANMSFTGRMQLWKGGQEIQLFAAPGPTAGSVGVYLPDTGVMFTGDCVVAGMPPLLVEADTAVWQQTLQQIQNWPDPVHHIVPGRGKNGGLELVTAVSDYIQTMRQRLETHLAEQRPREEVQTYLPDFFHHSPDTRQSPEWLKKQVKLSLDHVYDEIQLTSGN